MRGERIQIPQKRAVIGPPAKLHLMALVADWCENSLNFRGIAMGLYRGWRGEALFPWLLWIRVCMRIMHCVCLLNLSVCLSVYQSVCLSSLSICLSVCMSLFPPLSPSLSLSLSQHMWCRPSRPGSRGRYREIQVFSWDSKSVPFPINLKLVEAHFPNYVSFIRNHYMRGSRKFCQRGSNLDNVFF